MNVQGLTRYGVIIILVLIIAGMGWFFWQQQTNKIPVGLLLSSGRIEGREVNVSSKVQGRINLLHVDEGNTVKKGQSLAVLESEQITAQVSAAQENLKIAQRQQEQAQLDLDYTQKNSETAIWAAQASLDNAKAQLTKAVSLKENSKRSYQRYRQLYQDGAISALDFDNKKADYETSSANVDAAMQVQEAAQANLKTALSSAVAVEIKQKQLETSLANVNAAQAKLQELTANKQELLVAAPIDGTVITRPVEAGQVVNAVSPLFVLVNLKNIYMKIYIPEPEIGKIKLGSEARVYVDAYPDRYFSGKVTKISDQAQFTPKNVETKEERVKLVFAIEVSIENEDSVLKPGMPGDVVLRWKEDVPWITPR